MIVGAALHLFLMRRAKGQALEMRGPEMLVALAGWSVMLTILLVWLATELLTSQSLVCIP